MIIVEEKRLKMSFEEKRDWISYGKWMISLTPLDVTQKRYLYKQPAFLLHIQPEFTRLG